MWNALVQVMRWASIASVGYFANDIGDGVSKVIPNATDPKTGKLTWYWILILFVVIFTILYFIGSLLMNFIPKKSRK